MKGIQVQEQEIVTFTSTPTEEKGVIHAHGKGVVMTTGTAAHGDRDSGRADPEMLLSIICQ